MSLLEGHADYVMDGVGPQVVPSVAEIREKFQQRRASGAGRLDAALRKLLGLDAKLRQYRDGERFVRAVVDEVGMEGFNRGLDLAEHTPDQVRDRQTRGLGRAGARTLRRVTPPRPVTDERSRNHPSEGPCARGGRAMLG
ncbi:hypothetical protein GCM10020221_24750 [Streptomyces thioluteus]|uniref:Uncharacterized protein n=1 Tax=Streptomyces thioluteus TaxID=66431 RepID=A0ABN3WV19_STRTU